MKMGLGLSADDGTPADAGRRLFAVSRGDIKQPNDADRLRKYLARFGLDFDTVRA